MNDQPKPQPPPPAPATSKRAVGMSRREFARRAALTALAPAALVPAANVAAAAEPPKLAPTAQSPANAQVATPAPAHGTAATAQAAADAIFPKLSAQSQAEADARVQSILGQYGDRLSDEQKADIRRLCVFAQPPLDRLRTYRLENGDGEALYLKPLVEREKKPPAPATSPKPASATPGATPPKKP